MNFKIAKICIRLLKVLLVGWVFFTYPTNVLWAWEVDFSRRLEFSHVKDTSRMPASQERSDTSSLFLSKLTETADPTQDIVIMNTGQGFIPDTVRLKQNSVYRIHIVNVNNKEKNVSFIVDAFSEHHNTLFGEVKSFAISPKVDGIFSFQCPETSIQGKFVVIPDSTGRPANVGI